MATNNCWCYYYSKISLLLPTLLLLLSCSLTNADADADKAECSDKLVELAPCLTYVQGGVKTPVPNCCTSLKEVLVNNPKCLCMLLKDINDPSLGIKINLTLAFALPKACSTPANISECPKLLNLPSNSKDADIFQQYGNMTQVPITTVKANTTASTSGNASAQNNATKPESSSAMGNCYHMGLDKQKTGALLQLMVVAGCGLLLLLSMPPLPF